MATKKTTRKPTRVGRTKTSKAALKAWATRRANAAALRRSKAARKAVRTRNSNR